MTYTCHGCRIEHSTENMVAYCAVCFSNERENSAKLEAVVEAAKDALFDYTQLMNRIAEVQAHEVFSDDFVSKSRKGGMKLVKALAALEER